MTTSAPAPVEKVSQDEMLKQFKDRYSALVKENQDLSAKIKENEVTALKPVSYKHLTLPTIYSV